MVPGLGSEQAGMAEQFSDASCAFRDKLKRLNELVEDTCNVSVASFLLDSTSGSTQTVSTPKLHLSHAVYHLCAFQHLAHMGYRPDALLGCSLGEWVCAILSGSIDETSGLKAISEQATLFDHICASGGMLSVVATHETLAGYLLSLPNVWIAGENCEGNFLVTGSTSALRECTARFDKNNIIYQQLSVPHPYHSPLVSALKSCHKELLDDFKPPEYPVYCASTCELETAFTSQLLWGSIRYSIEFKRLITSILTVGGVEFLDCSHSGFLSNLVTSISKGQIKSVKINEMRSSTQYTM